MIRHICMFKLKEDHKSENLQAFVTNAQSLREIEQLRGFQVVCNAQGMPESNYDVSLIFDFDNAEDLDAYQAHPIHRAFGAFVSQVREARACIDYYFDN